MIENNSIKNNVNRRNAVLKNCMYKLIQIMWIFISYLCVFFEWFFEDEENDDVNYENVDEIEEIDNNSLQDQSKSVIGESECTVPLVAERVHLEVLVGTNFLDLILIDCGAASNVISVTRLNEIKNKTKFKPIKVEANIPSLIDFSGTPIKTLGVVLLDLNFLGSNLKLNKIPFIVLNEPEKFILGMPTFRSRNVSLINDCGDYRLESGLTENKIIDDKSVIEEINLASSKVKINYDQYEPIQIYSETERNAEIGRIVSLNCSVGLDVCSNIESLIVEIDEPLCKSVGLVNPSKKGFFKLFVVNNGNFPFQIEKGQQIGIGYVLKREDFQVHKMPMISEMSAVISEKNMIGYQCLCEIKNLDEKAFMVSFGFDDVPSFFNYNLDKLILDPEKTDINNFLEYDDNFDVQKFNVYFVIRDLFTLTVRQTSILTRIAYKYNKMKIVCLNSPHLDHIKSQVGILRIGVNTWPQAKMVSSFSFADYPKMIFEADHDLKSTIRSSFAKINLTLHLPVVLQNNLGVLESLKACVNRHFITKKTLFLYEKTLISENTEIMWQKLGFVDHKNIGGFEFLINCHKCIVCKGFSKVPMIHHEENIEIDEIKDHSPERNYSKFKNIAIIDELKLIDVLEPYCLKNFSNEINEIVYNREKHGPEITKEELESNCNDFEIGDFVPPETAASWRDLFDINTVDEFHRDWVETMLDEHSDILQLNKSHRGTLKLPFKYTVKFKNENIPQFRRTSYSCPPLLSIFMEQAVKNMLSQNIIRESRICDEPIYFSPCFLVPRNSRTSFY